jgi:hypothetical protein
MESRQMMLESSIAVGKCILIVTTESAGLNEGRSIDMRMNERSQSKINPISRPL